MKMARYLEYLKGKFCVWLIKNHSWFIRRFVDKTSDLHSTPGGFAAKRNMSIQLMYLLYELDDWGMRLLEGRTTNTLVYECEHLYDDYDRYRDWVEFLSTLEAVRVIRWFTTTKELTLRDTNALMSERTHPVYNEVQRHLEELGAEPLDLSGIGYDI